MLAWTLSQLRSPFICGEICRSRNINFVSKCSMKVIVSVLVTPSTLIGGRRSDARFCRISLAPKYPEAVGWPMSEIKAPTHDWLRCAVPGRLPAEPLPLWKQFAIKVSSPVQPEPWLPTSWCLSATGRVTGTRRTGSAAGLTLTWARQARARRGEAARLWKVSLCVQSNALLRLHNRF